MTRGLFAFLVFLPCLTLAQEPAAKLDAILKAARDQVGVTVTYDPSYRKLSFPGGDVPMDRGVCTDVIIRAYRAAGVDLQLLVHYDMKDAFSRYPRSWGLSRPDPNIDHRRVQNLAVYFSRHGQVLPRSNEAADYKPGDIVTWKLPDGHPHIGLIFNEIAGGRSLIIHNIGMGTKAEDILFSFTMTGHYRYMP
jgi:uncharacterized protein YijF (DUF1287 family)